MLAFRNHNRYLRQTVWVTLLAWLFALTAGVVNACMLSGPGAATRELVAELRPAHSAKATADAEHHGHSLAVDREHEQVNTNHSCLKFCDDESSALSKGSATALDLGVVLAATAQWPRAVVPSTNVGTVLSPHWPTALGPPLVIRLLRLTL